MNGVPGMELSPTAQIEYPASDGEPMAETGLHDGWLLGDVGW